MMGNNRPFAWDALPADIFEKVFLILWGTPNEPIHGNSVNVGDIIAARLACKSWAERVEKATPYMSPSLHAPPVAEWQRRFCGLRSIRLGGAQLEALSSGDSTDGIRARGLDSSRAQCRFLKALPRYLQGLTLHECLRLDEESLHCIAALPKLKQLSLPKCWKLKDRHLKALKGRMPALSHLDLSYCWPITGTGIECLSGLPNLTHLSLERTWVTDEDLHPLRSMKLQLLNLAACHRLSPTVLPILGQIPTLTSLNLSNCPDAAEEGLAPLQPLTMLKELRLDGCMLLGHCYLEQLQPLKAMSTLSLRGCEGITDDALETLTSFSALVELDLSFCCKVRDLRALRDLPALAQLKLTGCSKINDATLKVLLIQGFQSLSYVDISGCPGITTTGARALASSTRINVAAVDRRLNGLVPVNNELISGDE